MASLSSAKLYVGLGHAGVWNDPLNWAKGSVPGTADTALITQSAVLNGPIDVNTLMLLGNETITINGQIKTESTNVCESFMVCEGSTTDFTAGSSLSDAGGFECGVDDVGTTNIAAASGGEAAAVVNAAVMKIGQLDGGIGTVTVAGVLNVAHAAYIGLEGLGTLDVSGTGQANFTGLTLGDMTGAAGSMALSGTAAANVAGYLVVGTSVAGAPGGVGTVTVAGNSNLYCDHSILVNSGSSVILAGGTMVQGVDGNGVIIGPGGSVSGHGTVSSLQHGVMDNGVLASSGGTLVVNGNVSGIGAVQIGAGSTLDLNASKIGVPSIAFLGTGDTLGLATGVFGSLTITGFGSGDEIVMKGIDQASWSGTSDVLSLSEHGQVMDRLTLVGVAANAVFHVTPGANGSDIAMMPAMTGALHIG
jgi:hypothetical protein